MKNLKHYFLGGLIFSGTVIISFVGFAAYTNLPTQNNGDKMTSIIWNNLINKVNTIGTKVDTLSNTPTGAIMSFYLSSCPTGWIPANGTNGTPDLRGEFIRGLDSGRGVDSGRTLGSFQSDIFKSHHHAQATQNGLSGNRETSNNIGQGYDYGDGYGEVPTSDVGGTETRPRNVALLYCMKQ